MPELAAAPGWYPVCALVRARIGEATWRGHAVAVYLDGDGQPHVVQRFCPHLGASFATGGRLVLDLDDVRDDFDVWQPKRYLDQPIVVDGDGPIHRYRQWARQFYVDPSETSAAREQIAS